MYKRFLVLANSKKNGLHCVAGVDSDGELIRLVNRGGSELSDRDIRSEDGEIPKPLSTWTVAVIEREPLYYQPENWIIDGDEYWEMSDEWMNPYLEPLVSSDKYILGGPDPKISSKSKRFPKNSLAVVRVNYLTCTKLYKSKKVQVRAKFNYGGNSYDLPVTDPEWEMQFKDSDGPYWDFGDYVFDEGYYLVIGLGQEYEGFHYKLVVTIIPIDLVDEEHSEYLIWKDANQ